MPVTYCRLYRFCRNLAKGGCVLSRFHFTRCRYFWGHVACWNLPWQGLTQHHFVPVPRHWFSSTKCGKPLRCSEWWKIWHLKHNLTQVKILEGATMFNFWKMPMIRRKRKGMLGMTRPLKPKPLKKKNDRFSWPSLWLKSCIWVPEQGGLSKISCSIIDFIHYHKGRKV